jgi:hypothetical protein
MTYDQVVTVVGHLDDETVARIVDSGATPAELAEAVTWFDAEEAIGTNPRHQMTVTVTRLYEILLAAQESDDEHDR